MHNSCEEVKDFSNYIIIKNVITVELQKPLDRQEIYEIVMKMWNIEKFRFHDDTEDRNWTTAYAVFKDHTSAQAAVDYLNVKDSLSAGFISPIFDIYKEKETKLKPCFGSSTLIAVTQKNCTLSEDRLLRIFSRYGDICEFSFGETTVVGYEYFSQALAAEVDNNKWDDDLYLSVLLLRNLKEYVLCFLATVENFFPDEKRIANAAAMNDNKSNFDFAEEITKVLKHKASLSKNSANNMGYAQLDAVSELPCDIGFETQQDNSICAENEMEHVDNEELYASYGEPYSGNGENGGHFGVPPSPPFSGEDNSSSSGNTDQNNGSYFGYAAPATTAWPYYYSHGNSGFIPYFYGMNPMNAECTNHYEYRHQFLPNIKSPLKGSARMKRERSGSSRKVSVTRDEDKLNK